VDILIFKVSKMIHLKTVLFGSKSLEITVISITNEFFLKKSEIVFFFSELSKILRDVETNFSTLMK